MSFYSGVSNFNSTGPYDAFWQTGSWDDPDHITVCATNGYTLVTTAQGALRSTPSGRTWDGTTVSGSQVNIDGRPGTKTAKVLWLAVKNAGGDAATLAQIQREANARGSQGLTQIIKSMIQLITNNFSAIVHLPEGEGLIPFPWGTLPAIPDGWSVGAPAGMVPIQCTQPYLPDGPDAPAPGEPAPPPPSPVQVAPPAPEQGGPPIPPAPAPSEEDVPRPPGRSPMTVVQNGISWGPIAIAAALIVTAIFVGNSLRSEMTPPPPAPRVTRSAGRSSGRKR